MKQVFTLLAVFLVLTCPFRSGAQDIHQLEKIVVSATKIPEPLKDIPNSVILKEAQDIELSGARSIGELLANDPGIDWQTYGDYGGAAENIHIRGMRGDATQVFINGLNVNSPSLGTADVGKIPVENIDRIEVVKGSGSLLYGSGAMGGTVNVFTKSPKKGMVDLKVRAGYGSQNTYRLYAQHGMYANDYFGYYLTAGRTETDGFRDNGYLRQYDTSAKLVLDRGDLLKVSLYGDYLTRKSGNPGVKPPAGTGEYSIAGTAFYNDESASMTDYSKDRDGNVVLEVNGSPAKQFAYNIKGYYTNTTNNNYERYASTGGTGSVNWITNVVAGTVGHVSIYPLEGARLLLGGEYKEFDWGNEAYDLDTVGARTTRTKDTAHIITKALFTEGEYRPSKYFKAIAGIRREDHSAFGRKDLPLFGLVVNPSPTTVIKASHGKHFKAPTPNDLYWPAGPYTAGNPDLKPEVGWHSDITCEQSLLNDKLFFTVSYFHWNVDNKIQWEPDSNGVFKPINLGDFKADGIETGIRIGPFHNATLSLSYTYTDAEEKSREYTKQDYGWPPFIPADFQYSLVTRRATMVPRNQFKGEFLYKMDFGLTATLTARYMGDRVTYRTETIVYPATQTAKYSINSYWTVDMRLEQRLYRNWRIALDGKNLLDKDYDARSGIFYDSAGNSKVSGYPGAGRSVFLGVSYEF
ncbi:MAG: TonB-dependent receptor [Syntrophorhabdus sp.]|nr:TonB-dependent receptor [Syntrophorhabdus sp.]